MAKLPFLKRFFLRFQEKDDFIRNAVEESAWIHIESIQDPSSKRIYRARLHDGEVEVMVLAQEHGDDHLVIIDDYAARQTAQFLGLNLTGTMGS